MSAARPFLKWIGGKRKLLPYLLPLVPEQIETYYEPFVGGGALFWALAAEGRFKRAVLSDVNVELIRTYSAIKSQPDDVLEALGRHIHTKEHFLAVRAQDPIALTFAECAARMIFLNKTCINGLYRVNQRGQFNASFGTYKPMTRFIDPDVLHACSSALQGVGLYSMRWEDTLGSSPGPAAGDFVYMDPPYVPASTTANFTGYAAGGFSQQNQSDMCTWAIAAAKRGVGVMASNSDTDWVRRNYGADFDLHEATRAGTMNSDVEKRHAVPELIMRGGPR